MAEQEAVAAEVAPEIEVTTEADATTEPAPSPDAQETAAAEPPEPDPDQRSRENRIAKLASRPVSVVVAAMNNLSTDELRLLYEYESSHKARKTVLAAIERAQRPSSALVYTSEGDDT